MAAMSDDEVTGFELLSDEMVGEGGFLTVRRLRMRNLRADGSHSATYLVDYLARPKGIDAVVVAIWHRRADGTVEVLLRDGLRPPLYLGRPQDRLVVPDDKVYLRFREVVAGIVETDDHGEAGLLRRAAMEVEEEAGFVVDAAKIERLGAGTFPSPGAMPERFFLCAVEIDDPSAAHVPGGDGSPLEEGAGISWMGLDAAIDACVRGELEDAKSELVLRRLRDRLRQG
jgi:ADP-ribose pyrophosphatase